MWTKAHSEHQTSTKKHLLRGQAVAIPSPRPQKIPFLWTKVPSRHRTSTKMPPPVDKSPLPTPDFHKNAPACGQKSPPGTKLPQKCPRLWTKVPSRHQTSTKSTLCVDRRQLFLSGDTTGGAAGDTTGGAFTCREEGIKNYLV